MKNKKFLILIVVIAGLIVSGFIYLFSAQALISPQIYFTDLKLSKTNFLPAETIEGEVSLWNYEEFSVSDLVFYFQLLGGETNGIATQMLDNQKDKTIFSLSANEKATKSFFYNLPQNLPKGSYKFRIQLANSRGEEMSWIDKVIEIGGEGKFLLADNYWIVKEGKDLSPGGGVEYQVGEIPQIRFDITNNSNFTITAFPQIITYKRNVGGEVVQEKTEKNIILTPQQKQTLKISLPQLTKPDTYLSEVRLYDSESKEPISNSIYFRWIIAGEGAQILFVNPNKDSYEKGEEAKIKIQFTGPAHEIEGGEGEINIKLFNQEGKLVGEGKKEVQLKTGQATIDIPIKEKVENPKALTQIVKDKKILDQYEFQTKPTITTITKEEKISFWEKNKNLILIILILIILSIGAIIYYLKTKRMKGVKTLILVALFGAGIGFANSILAATEVTAGCCDTTVVFNSPLPNKTYKPGDTINFSGKFRVTGCGDGLFFNKVTFYITEDKEIPITDCCGQPTNNCSVGTSCLCAEGCQNCYGAESSNYSSCNFQWCDEVKYLNPSGYKVRQLGTIYPSDVASGATPYWVEYNQYFTIPEDLGFWGPVRLYVQYSGTHWNNHWHWNIAYQSGYIEKPNQPPLATNLSVSQPDYRVSGPAAIFSWTFSDPDAGDTQSAYQVQADNNSDFSSPEVDYGKIFSVSNSHATNPGALSYNNTYYWRVEVWDNNLASGWVSGSPFSTPKHAYPTVNFSWAPIYPSANETVQFVDQSAVYGDATKQTWLWSIPDAIYIGGTDSSSPNPQVKFNSTGNKSVSLTLTDSDGYSNEKMLPMTIRLPLPGWKEVAP